MRLTLDRLTPGLPGNLELRCIGICLPRLDHCHPLIRRQPAPHGRATGRQRNAVAIGDPPDRRIAHIAERARYPRRVGILFERRNNLRSISGVNRRMHRDRQQI
jgi:hypothetical protein